MASDRNNLSNKSKIVCTVDVSGHSAAVCVLEITLLYDEFLVHTQALCQAWEGYDKAALFII